MINNALKPYPGEDDISFTKRKAYFIREVAPRNKYYREVISKRTNNSIRLNESEKDEIREFWAGFLSEGLRDRLIGLDDYGFYKLADCNNGGLSHYMPDKFYYPFVDEYFTNPQHSKSFDDKNLYDLFFHDVKRPKTLFRKIRNLYLNSDYQVISREQALRLAKDNDEVILKITKFSEGGRGIKFWKASENEDKDLLDFLNQSNHVICQNVIRQHAELSRLNPSSVNTVRVMTLMFDDKANVLSSVLRMGVNGSRVDNASSGGIVSGIMPDGRLKDVAFDTSGKKYLRHPQGTAFNSVLIPGFSQCIELASTLAYRFSSISRLISWDFAIGEDGMPLLIEFNVTWGQLDFHQLCNGPIFGDLTKDVLNDVFANSYTLKSIIKSFQ